MNIYSSIIKLILLIGIFLVIFGLLASTTTAFYNLFFAEKATSVSMYAESLLPSWQSKTSMAGLFISAIGLLAFIPFRNKVGQVITLTSKV